MSAIMNVGLYKSVLDYESRSRHFSGDVGNFYCKLLFLYAVSVVPYQLLARITS